MKRISDHLYVHRSTCSVYALLGREGIVLIDFGDGSILEALRHCEAAQGLPILAVLVTHHHRDQVQGLKRAVQSRIPVYVPHAEQDLIARVSSHWTSREIYNNYNVRQDLFSALDDIEVSGTLEDYARLSYGDIRLEVVPTPGHTIGSISLMAEVDGLRCAFTGDLIYGPGKVWSLAATQWTYNGAEGVLYSLLSLRDLAQRAPSLLLPSHGEVMTEPDDAIQLLMRNLESLLRLRGQYANVEDLLAHPYKSLTSHLLMSKTCFANSYVLLSETGEALVVDFGYDAWFGWFAGSDRAARRPWLYNLPALKEQFGVTRITAAIPTHYHDDHVAGLNLLRATEGTRIIVPRHFADVLADPSRCDLPCLWFDPIPADQVVDFDESIHWNEYTLHIHPQPGHTRYAVAISVEVDGQLALFIGDQQNSDLRLNNYVYANRFSIDDYVTSAALYRRLRPDILLSGHWDPVWTREETFTALTDQGEQLADLHRALLPLADADLDAEGFAARLEPYQAVVGSNQPLLYTVEVRNPFGRAVRGLVEVVVPSGFAASPGRQELALEPGATSVLTFELSTDGTTRVQRARIAVDVTIDSVRLGQQAHALVTIVPARDGA